MICANPAFEFLSDPRICEIARIAIGATGSALIGSVLIVALFTCWITPAGSEGHLRLSLASLGLSTAMAGGIGLVLCILSRG